MMRQACAVALLCLALAPRPARADDRYAVTGMVLEVDPSRRTFVASIDTIPDFMAAMTMPFRVREAGELDGVRPGALVAFTLVVGTADSHVERLRVRRYANVQPDPGRARRLALLREIARGVESRALAPGATVPDFALVDSRGRPVRLSEYRGRVVAINFTYTTCQLPDYCLRIVNHFGVLQKRFAGQLGRDLAFLTITFDPARDTPEVLEAYAAQWDPRSDHWRFLTGAADSLQPVLDLFGVAAFPAEGLLDHALHTVVIDRDGRMAVNLEGNEYTSTQLGDLIAVVAGR